MENNEQKQADVVDIQPAETAQETETPKEVKAWSSKECKENGLSDGLVNGVDMLQNLGLTFEILKLLAPLGHPGVHQCLRFLSNLHQGTLDECLNFPDAEKVPQFAKFFSQIEPEEQAMKRLAEAEAKAQSELDAKIDKVVEEVVDKAVDKLLND